ncbi:MAG TPA: DUF1731 domain-containing protein, partial [Saprospiraceae bacterium]|nr:DUF1731 domain-containing protein [Saprospiraceae bacterium]
VSNKYMTACILKQKNSLGILLSIPVFVLKIMLGEMADVILSSNRVSPEKLISTGFKFSFPVIETALKDIFTNKQ